MRRPAFLKAVWAGGGAAQLDAASAEPHYALARIHRRRGETAKANRALELFKRLNAEKKKAGSGPS